MPRRDDIEKILIIGSGPIVIGQAAEFDYSGTQACRALRDEGYRVVLVNSNPATIMTDPEVADVTYVEPLTVEAVSEVLRKLYLHMTRARIYDRDYAIPSTSRMQNINFSETTSRTTSTANSSSWLICRSVCASCKQDSSRSA